MNSNQPTMRELYEARMRQPLYFAYRACDIQLNLELENPTAKPKDAGYIYVWRARVGDKVVFISEEVKEVAQGEARRLGLKFARLRWVKLEGTESNLPKRGVVYNVRRDSEVWCYV